MREKLIEFKKLTELVGAARCSKLGRNLDEKQRDAFIADYLIANGVTAQKKGEWDFGGDGLVECSECKETYEARMLLPRNYCPNCGADMRGDSDA